MNNKVRSVSFSAALVTLLGLVLLTQPAQAQTFTVIHTFTGGADGANPHAGLTIDGTGNLYGTAARGGVGYGTVFKLAHKNSQWMFASLYSFAGGYGGSEPYARVVIGSDDTLYGTTFAGGYGGCSYGGHFGCGTVFNVRPPASVCRISFCSWMATVLYHFTGSPPDGRNPLGDLAFDHAGNIYGTTFEGGSSRDGSVYKLAPSDGGWTESILYSFLGGNDGSNPGSGLTFDSVGNLYGTALGGGDNGEGTVYELMPSGSGWTKKTLYNFDCYLHGCGPYAGVIFDEAGNLYGATTTEGAGSGGTAFELSPLNGNWTFALLYSFIGGQNSGPAATLIMDNAGNLYGTTVEGGAYGYGSVFELAPASGGWTFTSLHDFTGERDGAYPYSSVAFDSNGNLYGTASEGGSGIDCLNGCGVVWEITP